MPSQIYATLLFLIFLHLTSLSNIVNAQLSCTTTDGSKANAIDCACGTTECTAATGRKCVAALDFCTSGFVPGDVTLSGSTFSPTRMGKYIWSGSTLNGKPTYKYSTVFLYWHSGNKKWYIGYKCHESRHNDK